VEIPIEEEEEEEEWWWKVSRFSYAELLPNVGIL